MPRYDYDLFVIGGGSGGVRAARRSAELGARVALCEERYLGGTCVNVGCVPKKLLVIGSHVAEEVADAEAYGWDIPPPRLDWPRLMANKNREIARLNGVYRGLLEKPGVQVLDGRGTLRDAHTVEVNEQRHTAERILIATGSWPSVPELPGRELGFTSNEAFFLERLPERIVIYGGGYVAVEFAGIFNGFGAQVSQLYRGPLFLRGFDDDARAFLAEEMRKKGVELRFSTRILRIEKGPRGLHLALNDGKRLETDAVLFATGRTPNTAGLGLEAAGVRTGARGAIVVDEHLRTSVPTIHALGDVIDRVALTPVAIAEGEALAQSLYGPQPRTVSYADIPTAVFSQPALARVGLTETEARERHGAVRVYRSEFRPLKHTLSGSGERTLLKLIVAEAGDRVVGCHMVGPEAGEIIQGLAIALRCGATKAQFDATLGIHPTSAEEWVTLRTPSPPAAARQPA